MLDRLQPQFHPQLLPYGVHRTTHGMVRQDVARQWREVGDGKAEGTDVAHPALDGPSAMRHLLRGEARAWIGRHLRLHKSWSNGQKRGSC
jgi:hypothetical protein